MKQFRKKQNEFWGDFPYSAQSGKIQVKVLKAEEASTEVAMRLAKEVMEWRENQEKPALYHMYVCLR